MKIFINTKPLMKTINFLFFIICMLTSGSLFSQLVADAGKDKIVCVDWHGIIDTISIGGDPAAFGGTPPYTYIWETEYTYTISSFSVTYTASDFLNDTTIPNPEVIFAFGDTIEFTLKVVDSENNTVYDTTNIYFNYFGSTLGYLVHYIYAGDSVFLSGGHNIGGGIPPFEYLWRPNHGLTDSTSLSFWAKPEYSVNYYITLTDSAGCVVEGAAFHVVIVLPVGLEKYEKQQSMIKTVPNPVNELLNVQISPSITGEFIMQLFLGNGKLIKQIVFHENEFTLDMSHFPSGIYLYKIHNNKGFSEQGRILVR